MKARDIIGKRVARVRQTPDALTESGEINTAIKKAAASAASETSAVLRLAKMEAMRDFYSTDERADQVLVLFHAQRAAARTRAAAWEAIEAERIRRAAEAEKRIAERQAAEHDDATEST